MPRSENLSRYIRRNLSFRKNSKANKNRRSIAPLLIAGFAVLAAVVFSVSVDSRSAGWLRKVMPSAPQSQLEAAKSSPTHSAALKSAPAPQPVSPFAPTVTASKTDALFTDVDVDAKADPGDTLKYSVVIGATGEDALGVTFTDTVDPNTTFVAGTLRTTPLARNDSYSAAGNIRITVAAPGVLANDSDADPVVNALTANAGTFLSAQGGNVNLSADGSFTYNPPAGFEGSDTFTYTLNDNDGEGSTDTATASITVTGMIWFINNTASSCLTVAAGCGRLTNPFSTLAAFAALNNGTGNNPAANDNIFVYESATDYVGPVTLLNGQKFIGQDATDTLSNISGVVPPAGSDALPATSPGAPIVNITSAALAITVGQNNILRGFTGGNSTGDINGTGFGTLNVSDVTLNGTGRALNLTTGTLNGTFASISSTNSTTTGISLSAVGGSLTTGSTTITNPTQAGISVNASSLPLSFANTSVTGAGGTSVSLTTNTGAITFGSLDITPDASQRGLLATDNTQTITIPSGTIITSGAAGVEISRATSTTPLAVALTRVSTTGGPNGIFLKNTSGSFSVNGDGTNTALGGNSTAGIISGMTGADSTTAGIGVYAENVQNLTLRRMTINGTNQNYGIRGLAVNNFTLEYSTVNGTNGNNPAPAVPNGAGEGSIYFGNDVLTGITGTGTFTNLVIAGGRARNMSVINISGTLNRLNVTGSQFGLNQSFIDANDSLSVESRNAGTVLNATIRGNTFTGAPGDLVEFVANSQSTMDLIMGGAAAGQLNTLSNNHPNNNVGGGGVTIASGGTLTFNVSNNTMRDANGSAITLQMATPGAGSPLFRSINGTLNANTIGVNAVAGSGSATANGIFLSFADNQTAPRSQATVAITNNVIRRYNGIAGISADNTGGAYDVNLTITGNNVSQPGAGAFGGLVLGAGAPASTDDIDVCASITGNDFSGGAPAGGTDIFLAVSSGNSSLRLPGLTTPATQGGVTSFVLANNNVGGTTVDAIADAPATFAANYLGGAACTSPSAMVLPLKWTGRDTFAVRREVNRTAPKSLSHHAKITKGNTVTPSIDVARNTAGTTIVTAPAVVKPAVTNPVVNRITSRQQLNAMQDKKPRTGLRVKPRVSALGGETVSHSIGTLLAGKTVRIQFQVTVNSPYTGGATVSNQGTVSGSNFSDVLTDDPAVGGANDPTLTPIVDTPNVSVTDAQANEPSSGSLPMLFTISLSSPAPAGGASVHYQTADIVPGQQPPGTDLAVAGVDYTAVADTVLNFAAGEQFKTVTVNILADASSPENDEAFLLNLSSPTNAIIADGEATGLIKQGNAAGTFLISEIRTSGPGGAGDDFVELYNNSDTPVTVQGSFSSAGYGLFKMGADCNATPVLIGVIPNGTVIPARGHYLFVGSAYSLSNYGGTGTAAGNQTLLADIESDANVGIFTGSLVANLSSATRLDAVGFGSNTGGNCDLLREGTNLPPLSGSVLEHSYVRDECGKKGNPATFGPCPTAGAVKDSNVNNDDFIFVDTTGANTPAGQRLGAPGPQNLGSPIVRNTTISTLLLDSNIGAPSSPNRVRDFTAVPPNATNGTLSVRRRFVNNTGAPITRLRFRIVDMSSLAVPGGIADLRALTSSNVTVNGITDAGTCLASNGVATTPCSITVLGTTLEQPPAQASGGAHNSSMSAGTITLATPLAPGGSINLQFLLGVQQTGSFKFFFNIEALP